MNKVISLEKVVKCERCSLSDICFPHGLSEGDMTAIDTMVEQHPVIHKSETLFAEGDSCHQVYAVRSGSLKTTVQNEAGDSQIVGFHFPGELIGFDGFATDEHTVTAEALETTSVCALSLDSLDSLATTVSGLHKQLRRIMGLVVKGDHDLSLMLGKMSSDQKLATFLITLSLRMKERGWKEDEFNLAMSRQDIANFLGIAVETVSRLFAQFQEKGLIHVDKRHVKILDRGSLLKTSGSCSCT